MKEVVAVLSELEGGEGKMVERTRSGDYAEDFTVEINSDPPEPSVSESGLLYRQTVPTSEKPLRQ